MSNSIDLNGFLSHRIEEIRSVGLPGNVTALSLAMMMSSPNVVQELLKAGADPNISSKVNMDSLMLASTFGRTDNIKFWLDTFPDWKIADRVLTFNGASALNLCARIGQNNHEAFDLLIRRDVQLLKKHNFLGHTVLQSAVENEDCDPEIVRSILRHVKKMVRSKSEFLEFINYRIRPPTLLFKVIFFVAKSSLRLGSRSLSLNEFAQIPGTTALNLAVKRGDAEITRILLDNGADPYVVNDLGINAFEMCKTFGPYPSVRTVLLEHELKKVDDDADAA